MPATMGFVAHALGADGLPFPVWFLAYGGAAAVVLTALWLRTTWPTPRLRTPLAAVATEEHERAPSLIGRAIGLGLLVVTIAAAVVGPDSAASNIAPVAVTVVWWVGLPLLCLVAGDVFRALSPFDTIVAVIQRALPRRRAPSGDGPSWTAAVFIFAFAWYWLAYHRPGSARALAVFLVVYSLAAVAGGLLWGRRWVRHGEGFAALSASIATIGLRRRAAVVPPGVVPFAVVWLGSTLFDSISSSDVWVEEVLGTSTGWERTALNTVGLVWFAAIVAGALLGAARVASARDPEAGPVAIAVLGRALVPIALAWFIAHDLTLLLFEGQNFLALLSDPLGRGWDLFGTITSTVDYSIIESGWVRTAEAAALVIGHLGAVLIAHDAALRRLRRRAAVRITWAASGLAAVSIVAAVLLILGGD